MQRLRAFDLVVSVLSVAGYAAGVWIASPGRALDHGVHDRGHARGHRRGRMIDAVVCHFYRREWL